MSERTDFLYPFIEPLTGPLTGSGERDATALLDDLARSARAKAAASSHLRETTLDASVLVLEAAAAAIAERLEVGRRMFFFGNGGSSSDAASLANLFGRPSTGRPVAARHLGDDGAVLTALSNDVGFDLVFSRQLIAHAHAGDIAVGLSTSGNSRNLLMAFATAADRGLLTIGIAGYAGGEMVRSGHVQHCLVVDDDSVHRIQEAQAALGFELWRRVQVRLTAAKPAQTPAQKEVGEHVRRP
jgi:D-sedoheptulose 7-phosphate isomerase